MLVKSRLPFTVATPDLFVCPFLAAIAGTLAEEIDDDDDLTSTFLFVNLFTVSLMGLLLLCAGAMPMLRIAEFTPFPVVSGLVAR